MKKIIIIPLMIICLALSVFAYDVNDTLRINGEYKVAGVLSNVTDTNITIFYPNGLTAIDNIEMNYSSVGLWYYDYILPETNGEYEVLIMFTDSSVYKGNETSTFWVGDVNVLSWNVCPTGTQGWVGMWIFFIILIIIGISGLAFKVPVMTGGAGAFFLLLSFMTWYCGDLYGYASAGLGFMFMLISVNIRN